MDSKKDKILIDFFNNIGIVCEKIEELEGTHIERNMLLNDERYKKAREHIPELRIIFSTTTMTSLQNPAEQNQKWPLINLTRQILKSCNYNLYPKRICDGYSKDGKKLYKRLYIIEKFITLENITQ
jgi:hypothetical protein